MTQELHSTIKSSSIGLQNILPIPEKLFENFNPFQVPFGLNTTIPEIIKYQLIFGINSYVPMNLGLISQVNTAIPYQQLSFPVNFHGSFEN